MSTCEHGADRDRHKQYGDMAFACPIGTCKCCGTRFPYTGMSTQSKDDYFSSEWTPIDLCEMCGGKYVQTGTPPLRSRSATQSP